MGAALELEGERVLVDAGGGVEDLRVEGADLDEGAAVEGDGGARGPVGDALAGEPVDRGAEGDVVEEAEGELEAVDVRRADAEGDAEDAVIEVARRTCDGAGEVAAQADTRGLAWP